MVQIPLLLAMNSTKCGLEEADNLYCGRRSPCW